MGTRSLTPHINSEDNGEISVSDNDISQATIKMLRELRKMNVQLEVMTGEKLTDGDYNEPN